MVTCGKLHNRMVNYILASCSLHRLVIKRLSTVRGNLNGLMVLELHRYTTCTIDRLAREKLLKLLVNSTHSGHIAPTCDCMEGSRSYDCMECDS